MVLINTVNKLLFFGLLIVLLYDSKIDETVKTFLFLVLAIIMEGSKVRRKSVHDQLRSDHIETLEVLQTYQDENTGLKSKIHELQAALNSMNSLYVDANDDDASCRLPHSDTVTSIIAASKSAGEMIQILQKNKDLSKEVQILKDRIKQYQLQEQKNSLPSASYKIPTASSSSSVEVLSSIIQKMKLKEFQDLQKYKELEKVIEEQEKHTEQLTSSYERKLEESKQNYLFLQNQLFTFQQSYQEMKNDLTNFHNRYNQCEKEKDQLKHQLSSQHQMKNHHDSILQEEKESSHQRITSLINQLKDKDFIINQLQDEIEDLKRRNSQLYIESQTLLNPSTIESSLLIESQLIEIQPVEQIIIVSPNLEISQTTLQESEEKGAGSPITNVRFQEFMNLKLENRELKLRLAELTHSSAHDFHRGPSSSDFVFEQPGHPNKDPGRKEVKPPKSKKGHRNMTGGTTFISNEKNILQRPSSSSSNPQLSLESDYGLPKQQKTKIRFPVLNRSPSEHR
jgi:DNA repair exonuclease SbcCD ATPase subunit